MDTFQNYFDFDTQCMTLKCGCVIELDDTYNHMARQYFQSYHSKKRCIEHTSVSNEHITMFMETLQQKCQVQELQDSINLREKHLHDLGVTLTHDLLSMKQDTSKVDDKPEME